MIYDISPNVFTGLAQYLQYVDFFYTPPDSIIMFINVTDRYVDTGMRIYTATGSVKYRNKMRIKT